ncbi:hypothetical protein EHS25_000574 [Saitozyma podzolica]|uniref:Uncharacterized protein n=1 Tax=Saitozyma podzolica TaxID=1890683 RepID=A0A427YWK5_9TREE|nr:hypothetical protein EHS25_000574 [Saitozyma podzolica]
MLPTLLLSLLLSVFAIFGSANPIAAPEAGAPVKRCTTNAECLRQRQPLLKPHPKRSRALAPRASGTSYSTRGYFKIVTTDGTTYGYLSSAANQGRFTNIVSSTTGALVLDASISLTGTTSSSGIGLQIDAADNYNTYPWISMIVNDTTTVDVNTGTYSYLIPVGTTSSNPNPTASQVGISYQSIPTGQAETFVWTYNPTTSEITATWTNTNTAANGASVTLQTAASKYGVYWTPSASTYITHNTAAQQVH